MRALERHESDRLTAEEWERLVRLRTTRPRPAQADLAALWTAPEGTVPVAGVPAAPVPAVRRRRPTRRLPPGRCWIAVPAA